MLQGQSVSFFMLVSTSTALFYIDSDVACAPMSALWVVPCDVLEKHLFSYFIAEILDQYLCRVFISNDLEVP